MVDVQWLYFQCCVEYLTRRQGRGQNGNGISLLYDYIRKGRGRNALLIKESTPAHWPNAERAFKVWHSENSQSFLSAVTTFTWERVRETERGTEGTKQLMIPYWSRSRNYCVVSEHLMSVMVKFSLMTNMTHGEVKNNERAFVLTCAMPVFLSHHHFLIFFSSREEGNSLAEAEAALSSWVMLHLWDLRTDWSGSTLNTFHKQSITLNKTTFLGWKGVEFTWSASLLPLANPSSPGGLGPWGPLRFVMGHGSFRYSDTTCKMHDTSSGTAMPSPSRICHLVTQMSLTKGLQVTFCAFI